MQMLKNLFKSKDKYYLELDDAVETAKKVGNVVQDKAADALESKPVQQAVETVKDAAEVAQDKLQSAVGTDVKTEAKSAAKSAKNKVEKVADNAKAEAKSAKNKVEKVADDAKSEAKSAANSAKKTVKGKKSTAKSNGKSPAKAKSSQNGGASSYDPPFWVAAMYKKSSGVNSDGSQAQQTFATDNLMPVMSKSRRRPGPSLNKFKDMANKAKTPKG